MMSEETGPAQVSRAYLYMVSPGRGVFQHPARDGSRRATWSGTGPHLNNRRKETVMKTSVRTLLAVVMGIALVSFTISCASTGAPSKGAAGEAQKVGFLGDYA